MISAPLPNNEDERLRWLRELDILDTLEERAYDDLTLLAAQICDVPIALVSLVDRDRQWFKSHHGLNARQTPREQAFCAHAILGDDLFVIEDSAQDARFHDNPLVTGEPHVKFYAGAPLILRDNIRLGTLCVIDNTPHSLTDSQRAALQALARQVVSQLELRLQVRDLQRLDSAKDEFISMVSHELRTPLTSISGALNLLVHRTVGELPPKAKEMAELANRNADRLLRIVNDILDIAKLEAGKLSLDCAALNLIELARQAIELNRIYAAGCGCQLVLRTDIDEPAAWVEGDSQRLLQVLSNLVSNAAKHGPQGDSIEVAVERSDARCEICVTDHGPGISAQAQEQLFERFTQLHDNGNTKLPGTGLGLNITKRLVELHHGTISVDSVPGQRTTFCVTLPALEPPNTSGG